MFRTAVTRWAGLFVCRSVLWSCKGGLWCCWGGDCWQKMLSSRRSMVPSPGAVRLGSVELLVLVQDVVFNCVMRGWVKLFCTCRSWLLGFSILLLAWEKECNSKATWSELTAKYCCWSAAGWLPIYHAVVLQLFKTNKQNLCHQSLGLLPKLQGRAAGMGIFNPSPNREDGKLSGNTEYCKCLLLQGTCIKAPCKWADGHSQLFSVGWQFNMSVHVQCQYRVTLRAGFVRGGVPGAWNVWSLNRKSPGTSATLPSLGFSGVCTSLSSNSSSGLKLLPIILSPKVIPEILSEHRQTQSSVGFLRRW